MAITFAEKIGNRSSCHTQGSIDAVACGINTVTADHRASQNLIPMGDIANAKIEEVEAAQFAGDGEIEHRQISNMMGVLKTNVDGPDVLGLEWRRLLNQASFVPGFPRLIGFHVFEMLPSMTPTLFSRAKQWARTIKRDVHALWFAARDPRTPWYAKVLALAVAAYALSPIDLIPDFIPVIGYLDDVVIVPLGVLLVVRLVPPDVMDECRASAAATASRPVSRVAAGVFVAIWIAGTLSAAYLLIR